jgi:hypothetical protein
MKNRISIIGTLLLALTLPFVAPTAFAQSAKVTAKTSRITLIPATTATSDWQTVLSNQIKTASQKDLFVGVSLETGLFTSTQVKSKNLVSDTSVAMAQAQVRVLIDGNELEPGVVTFGRRSQTLSATLEGAISGCLTIVTNPDGTQSIVLDPNCVTPEEISLILDTMDAATFNFVGVDIPVGTHTVSVQARVDTTGSAQAGSFSAQGAIGKGSMTVESVRLIKDPNVILDVP